VVQTAGQYIEVSGCMKAQHLPAGRSDR